jgi:hypothetical protein
VLALEMAAFWLAGKWVGATTAAVAVVGAAGNQYRSWNITCADGDTLIQFPHGFVNAAGASVVPDSFNIQTVTSPANTARPNWGASISGALVTLTKQPAVGSGGAPAAKLEVMLPHSIMQ